MWDAEAPQHGDGSTVTLTLAGPWERGEALVARFAPHD